ncbi:MAG: hypothetical protein VXW22_02500 [Pseudomonadota bacterium]|nr:hypothetical protein [Pseudomonadota bacterium]
MPHGHRRHGVYVGAMRMTLLVLAAAIVGLGLTLWGVAAMWKDLGVNMTLHGWIAYGLGGVVSLLLAGGLFFLTFKSARDGYDDIDRPEDLNE